MIAVWDVAAGAPERVVALPTAAPVTSVAWLGPAALVAGACLPDSRPVRGS